MSEKFENTTSALAIAAGLPRARAVHSDPDARPGIENGPLPEALAKHPAEGKSPARWAYERLLAYIQKFEAGLDAGEEVAMGFTGDTTTVLRIEGIGFFDPDILTFYGTDDRGAKAQLIQHVSQLSVVLRALPKPQADAPARRIGFRLAADLDALADESPET